MFRLKCLIAAALMACTVSFAAAQNLPAPSEWTNQRTSVLRIFWSYPDGRFAGTFTNNAPGFSCHATYPMTGTATGNQVAFVVNFWNCQSITNWSGTIRGNVMRTRWTLNYIENGTPKTMRGSDTFQRRN